MAGTVILTGANSSAGLHASEHLLKTYSSYTAIFTVRNVADNDENTNKLRAIIEKYPKASASIHELDLADLTAVHKFATTISDSIIAGEYPAIKSIICNAYYWNLVADPELTIDGFDRSLQVGHIAHVALILRLLDSFNPDGGRIELISSVLHYRKKNPVTNYLPEIPDDFDLFIHPRPDPDKFGRGYQRYGTLKLVVTTWACPLNEYLQKDPRFANISVVVMNPGNLGDSRTFRTNTPMSIQLMQMFILKPLMPILRYLDPIYRTSAEAGVDIIELGVGQANNGERGYYTFLKKDEPDPVALDKEIQHKIWVKSVEWARINKENTALKVAFK
ncbi:putative short-chain dehydrogenase [Hypoxylon trugodes]|uniref:putative short-chain dehydrogenase n=1 Tax=Hypoxylon trugodes TaxID=326681 RepID=UPI00219AA2F0|nr:putative short-chain dehydrogenase [Hypoxylon trugodes]KAI1392987.1 putative short-chain dehydrogenase [Hypoxylon trugodes]